MLKITVPESEYFDEVKEEFVHIKEQAMSLEHSLVSISRWEAKHCKTFLDKNHKTDEELRDYIRCMTLTQNVNPLVYYNLSNDNINDIIEYMNSPMTATTFNDNNMPNNRSNERITSELIYYWMFSFRIPKECEKWHINRLLTLIKIFGVKNGNDKKMPKNEILKQNAELNRARRKRLNTKG